MEWSRTRHRPRRERWKDAVPVGTPGPEKRWTQTLRTRRCGPADEQVRLKARVSGTMVRMAKAECSTFEDLVLIAREPLRPIMKSLREIILEIHPEACELVRLGHRAATYGVGPRKMVEGYAYVLPCRSWVNLGFFRGTTLEDPDGMLRGTGARMRHVRMRTIEDTAAPAVRGLIETALAERRQSLGV